MDVHLNVEWRVEPKVVRGYDSNEDVEHTARFGAYSLPATFILLVKLRVIPARSFSIGEKTGRRLRLVVNPLSSNVGSQRFGGGRPSDSTGKK